MQLSQSGLDFIKGEEGLELDVYPDSNGNPTIGYGHLLKPGENFTRISPEMAEQLLFQDVQDAVSTVNASVFVPLTQSMFDALVSLVFNWGSRNFKSSTHLQRLNAGDYSGTAQRIGEHPVTSGGVFVQGLQNRRNREKALFLSQGLPMGMPPDFPIRPVVARSRRHLPASQRKPKHPKQA